MLETCLKTESFVNPVKDAAQIFSEYEGFIRWVINSQNSTNLSDDDLFQDFYLQLISKPIPEDARNIKSFLYKAILNHLHDSYRRVCLYEKNIKKFRNISNYSVNKFDLTSALLVEEEMNKMFEFIKEISPGQRYMAITLRYRDGYSIQEIADKMGVKYSSVRRYISIGLRKVRKCINNA